MLVSMYKIIKACFSDEEVFLSTLEEQKKFGAARKRSKIPQRNKEAKRRLAKRNAFFKRQFLRVKYRLLFNARLNGRALAIFNHEMLHFSDDPHELKPFFDFCNNFNTNEDSLFRDFLRYLQKELGEDFEVYYQIVPNHASGKISIINIPPYSETKQFFKIIPFEIFSMKLVVKKKE